MGPVLIFDKSFLQGIDADEAVWLDHFFICNIVPIFYVETLADIAKNYSGKKIPDDVVANLAYKTPDLNSKSNVYHTSLLAGELTKRHPVPVNGQIPLSGGQVLELGDKHGVMYQESPEEEALRRWQQKDFWNLERNLARKWREDLSKLDLHKIHEEFQKFFPLDKPKTFENLKRRVDSYLENSSTEATLDFGLRLLNVPDKVIGEVISKWKSLQKPRIEEFAPYFNHMISVQFFFCMAVAADLISTSDHNNVTDFAYLYYLPFCNVFTSGDNLHKDVAPLFLRSDQIFVTAKDLKEDLRHINEYYIESTDGKELKNIYELANQLPLDNSFLVTKIHNKCFPKSDKAKPRNSTSDPEALNIMEKIKQFQNHGVSPSKEVSEETINFFYSEKRVSPRKGRWKRF